MTLYQGSCQCGAVTFEADLSLDNPVVCNCSRCRRVASVLVFTPEAQFTLKSGGANLTEFTFNKHHIRHQFCKTCGVQGFSMATAPDGTPTVAVNINCLDGVDGRALSAKAYMYDGASV